MLIIISPIKGIQATTDMLAGIAHTLNEYKAIFQFWNRFFFGML
jgi:hypothetical protein